MSSETNNESPPEVDLRTLSAIERTAVRLARTAGERIRDAYARPRDVALNVEFKAPWPGAAPNSNPVSEVDRDVEDFIRRELTAEFPGHALIGEESHGGVAAAGGSAANASVATLAPVHSSKSGITWVIDPVDGTSNYINGLPLFASSVGVLIDGWPLAGAIWCVCTHTLRSGVYHAHRGGPLCLDEEPVRRRSAAAWRGLAAEPGRAPQFAQHWDTRVLGSATLECAFVAAGLLRLAYVSRPSLWDAAAAVTLLEAAGCAALTQEHARWVPLKRFGVELDDESSTATLGRWCQPLLAGDAGALDLALRELMS